MGVGETEVAQFLVKVKTPEEVKEYTGAFLQLYREEAYYLDRTVHYIARVGLDYIKRKVVDDAASRKALHERLLFSLEGLRDPWAARIAGEARREYVPIKLVPAEVA